MQILTVVGARPQFVKAAVLSRAMAEQPDLSEILLHTGQHYDDNMSRVFLEELELPTPKYYLGIGSGDHGVQTGRMLGAIEKILLKETPDWVVVFGDTNSTLAGAVAAVKLHIPLAHVEAGLRSFNRCMPEEINRVLTDHASDLLFAPTDAAVANLLREGLPMERVREVGDVMCDAALYYAARAEERSDILSRLSLPHRGYVLATAHRAENTDEEGRLRAIFQSLRLVAQTLPVVVPLHPRTRAALERLGAVEALTAGLQITGPLGYLDMIMLEKHARLIATDSGGVQKEAYFFRVPCVTMRNETEWVELVQTGWNRLAPPASPEVIRKAVEEALDTEGEAVELYGNGGAGRRIVEEIRAYQRD